MFVCSLPFNCPIRQNNACSVIRNELSTNDRTAHIKNDIVIFVCHTHFTSSELTEEIAICVYEERTRRMSRQISNVDAVDAADAVDADAFHCAHFFPSKGALSGSRRLYVLKMRFLERSLKKFLNFSREFSMSSPVLLLIYCAWKHG